MKISRPELRVTSYWFRCPGFIVIWWSCYQYAFDLCLIFSSYCMNAVWKFGSVVLFNKVRDLHLHDACPVDYQDRKIDHMQFWPLPPEISYVSGNSQPSNEKYACGCAGSNREEMWNYYLQMKSLTCWGTWSIKSYTSSVAIMTWVGFSCCFVNNTIKNSTPWPWREFDRLIRLSA